MSGAHLEPDDVGPSAGGDLLATDLDRDHVVRLVSEAEREGLLSSIDRDRRIASARTAQTFDDLVPLTRDLVRPDGTIQRPSQVKVDTAGAVGSPDQIVAIFSGAVRRGHWRVRERTNVLATFGGVELDLTSAVFEAPEIIINCFCLFGGAEIIVPSGVEVRNQATGIMGGVEMKVDAPTPGAPVVIIRGVAAFGGIEIRRPKQKKRRG